MSLGWDRAATGILLFLLFLVTPSAVRCEGWDVSGKVGVEVGNQEGSRCTGARKTVVGRQRSEGPIAVVVEKLVMAVRVDNENVETYCFRTHHNDEDVLVLTK